MNKMSKLEIQSVIPRISSKLSAESAASKIDGKNQDIIAILTNLNDRMDQFEKTVSSRLEEIEKTQTDILKNQNILSVGQVTIVENQENIANKLNEIMESIVTKPKDMRVDEYVCRMSSETCDTLLDEIASMLPLETLVAVQDLEERLQGQQDFSEAMKSYLHTVKGASEEVSSVIRVLFTDELLENFNWDGRWEKEALGKLHLFNETLRDVFQHQEAFSFVRSVKKAIKLSHHRAKQKVYLKKKTKSILKKKKRK